MPLSLSLPPSHLSCRANPIQVSLPSPETPMHTTFIIMLNKSEDTAEHVHIPSAQRLHPSMALCISWRVEGGAFGLHNMCQFLPVVCAVLFLFRMLSCHDGRNSPCAFGECQWIRGEKTGLLNVLFSGLRFV